MSGKMKKGLSILITAICLGVFIYAGHGLITTYMDYSKNNKLVSDLQEQFYDAQDVEQDLHDDTLKVRPGFDALLKENDELVGWITVDGTEIDYPILQADNNNDYLRHDFFKDYNILGSIFMDFRNNITSGDLNTIIYGHRTRDGSMFEGLINYQDEEFFEKNRTITFDTLYESYEAEVFAVYNTLTDFNYIQTDFSSEEEYGQLLDEVKKRSMFESDVEVGTDDRIITLSTCEYSLDDDHGRLVVQAKLVKKS